MENITEQHQDWIIELTGIYGNLELIKYITEDLIHKQSLLCE